MENQEVFDRVAAHLFMRGRRSADSIGLCLYRAPDGLKCAVGALIPDELYTSDMEGSTVRVGAVRAALTCLGIDINLAIALQTVHDFRSPEDWASALDAVAAEFNLKFTPPTVQQGV